MFSTVKDENVLSLLYFSLVGVSQFVIASLVVNESFSAIVNECLPSSALLLLLLLLQDLTVQALHDMIV